MNFVDEVEIFIAAGNGADGTVSFRREKFIANGGPDGGDGGHGGSIYFVADNAINTLSKFRGKKRYFAGNGEKGHGQQKHGRNGDDLYIEVPIGTIITDLEYGHTLADLKDHGDNVLVAKGGRGGLGNAYFKSSTNRAPNFASEAKEGQEMELRLELKLIAEFALLGLPNAGKSTLIASITEAKPKIADYPFTTLVPNLGVVKIDNETSCTIADIPGIIEDASIGKGLGVQFLKHIERTKAFIHMIDISWCLDEYEAYEQYVVIRTELERYNKNLLDRKELICLTKIDALTDEEIEKYKCFFEKELDKKVLPISSVSGLNLDTLKHLLKIMLKG